MLIQPVPGHALHEKGLQKQRGVGSLVSSQERRAGFVPRINRTSTGRQPDVLFLIGLHGFLLARASEETFRTAVFDALEGTRDVCLLDEPIRRRPVLPGPALSRRPAMPPHPDPPVVCPGFGFDRSN